MALSRREFLTKSTAALAAATAAASVRAQSATGATISPMKEGPNVLYIIMEDIGPNLACYGEPLVKTPNVDRLAAQGVRFANTFCTAPVCSASRSALFTGAHQIFTGSHQHRTWQWHKQLLPSPVRHVCDWFRDAGYFTCNLKPAERVRGGITGPKGNGKIDLNFLTSESRPNDPFDGRDWNQRKEGQPFFAHITIFETHKGPGWKAARRQPKAELVDPEQLKLPPYYPDHPIARDEYANYLDAIHMSDGFVGELLARLESEGLAKNTIIVLSADHGPLFRGKQFLYDNGIRIPLIVKFPDGRSAGTVRNELVSGVDLAPTMLGFAGIELPAGATHGRNLFAANSKPVTEIFASRDRMDISIDRMRSVRTERYKYIRNYLPAVPYMQHNPYKEENYPTWNLVKQLHREGRLSKEADLFASETKPIEELFDLQADPHEVNNLAGDRAHAAVLKELRGKLDAWLKDHDRGFAYEDTVDIHRGYYRAFPGETAPKGNGEGV